MNRTIIFRKLILPCLLLIPGIAVLAQAGHTSGVSSITGNIYPAKANQGISLEKEIIKLNKLDTAVFYSILYQFRNTEKEYLTVEAITPFSLYFTDFRPDKRSSVLDGLAEIFPDLFKVEKTFTDIRGQLKNNFGQRLFVRKFLNPADLGKLGISYDLFRGDKPLEFSKVSLEFRWVDEDGNSNIQNSNTLQMEMKVYSQLQFKPDEQADILSYLRLPSLISGTKEMQFYAPFELLNAKLWEGSIREIYILNDMFQATLTLPKTMKYERFDHGLNDNLTLIKNPDPADPARIAFYTLRDISLNCGNNSSFEEFVYIPRAVSNISASSSVNGSIEIPDYQVSFSRELSHSSAIPEFQSGSPSDLSMLSMNLDNTLAYNEKLENLLSSQCVNGEASVKLNDYCNPALAFDISSNSAYSHLEQPREFFLQTAWCENASGSGKGQYIDFTLEQPAKSMRIYNGYQLNDEKYQSNSRVRTLILSSIDGTYSENLPVSDLKIMNLYPLNLKPGAYRLSIENTFNGKYSTACLSSISFEFEYENPWFADKLSLLENDTE